MYTCINCLLSLLLINFMLLINRFLDGPTETFSGRLALIVMSFAIPNLVIVVVIVAVLSMI